MTVSKKWQYDSPYIQHGPIPFKEMLLTEAGQRFRFSHKKAIHPVSPLKKEETHMITQIRKISKSPHSQSSSEQVPLFQRGI